MSCLKILSLQQKYDSDAKDKLYAEIPKYCTWNKIYKWQKKKSETIVKDRNYETRTIGRIPILAYNVRQKGLYYMRRMSHHV